jgi:hypothetical protein
MLLSVSSSADKKTQEPRGIDRASEWARLEVAEWIRSGNGPAVDVAAAEEVKHLGLSAAT